MNSQLLKILTLLFFLSALFYCNSQENNQCQILPSPVVYKRIKGNLYLPTKLSFHKDNWPKNSLSQFESMLLRFHGLGIKDTIGKSLIRLRKLKNVPKDFYSISISDFIFISYSNDQALYYAMQSLVQLIQTEDEIKYIPKAFVQDYPKFDWRGLHLDVSRHFFSVEQIKKYLDLMALYKFNTFHWHLTDDQGWRIEIKAYPELTKTGAYRDSTLIGHYTSIPRQYDKSRYGGFYTQDEIKDIVAYAQERYIEIVPEIEMPGHSRAALAAYPEFSCSGIQNSVPGIWGVFEDIYCSKEESFEFLTAILDEVVNLFPGKYIHIGGDEVPKSRWKTCTKCQNVIQNKGLANEHELQSYFITRIEKHLNKKGKKLIGWDEILEGGLSPNAAVMSWRGFEGGIAAAKKGHYVVMTPGSHCYFDHYQGKSNEEPLAIGGYTPLEKVYLFNPIPDELDAAQASFILGGQANLWTEYISDFKQLEYMAYPRAIALSQALWCNEKPEYEDFCKILYNSHYRNLALLDVNYSKSSQRATIRSQQHEKGISLTLNSRDTSDVFYTTIQTNNSKDDLKFDLGVGKELIMKRPGKSTIDYRLRFISKNSKISSVMELIGHHALGAKINYITKPNAQYNYSPSLLLDGQKGSRPWRGHEWIGFDTSSIVLEIALPKKKKIKTIEFSFLESNGSWIYLPHEIQVFPKSKRRKKKQSVKNINKELVRLKIRKRLETVRIEINTFSKIPKGLPGAGHTPWTFIDEIVFH
jgi:hexosaminidase